MKNIFSILGALSLGYLSATADAANVARAQAAVSRPTPGSYYITNRVLSPYGDKLAITYQGQGNYATVTPLKNLDSQQWSIRNYDANTQSVSPVTDSGYQAAWGHNAVTVLQNGAYVWTIRDGDNGTTIQDGGVTVFWGLNNAVEGSEVAVGAGTGSEKQDWIFTPA